MVVRTGWDKKPNRDKQPVLWTNSDCLSFLSRLYIGTSKGRVSESPPLKAESRTGTRTDLAYLETLTPDPTEDQ
jgi:hypothetical protein